MLLSVLNMNSNLFPIQPGEAAEKIRQLQHQFFGVSINFESILEEVAQDLRQRTLGEGTRFWDCVLQSSLSTIRFEAQDQRTYLRPKPLVEFEECYYPAREVKSPGTLKEAVAALQLLDTERTDIYVLTPLWQYGVYEETPRGLIIEAIRGGVTLVLDAIHLGLDVFKLPYAFQGSRSTFVTWSGKEVQALKATFRLQLNKVLLIQPLLFMPWVSRYETLDIEVAAIVAAGEKSWLELAKYLKKKDFDKDTFRSLMYQSALSMLAKTFITNYPLSTWQDIMFEGFYWNNEERQLGVFNNASQLLVDIFDDQQYFQQPRYEDLLTRLSVWSRVVAFKACRPKQAVLSDAAIRALLQIRERGEELTDTEWNSFFEDNNFPEETWIQRSLKQLLQEPTIQFLRQMVTELLKSQIRVSVELSSGYAGPMRQIAVAWNLRELDDATRKFYGIQTTWRECPEGSSMPQETVRFLILGEATENVDADNVVEVISRFCRPRNLVPWKNMSPEARRKYGCSNQDSGTFRYCCNHHGSSFPLSLILPGYRGILSFNLYPDQTPNADVEE